MFSIKKEHFPKIMGDTVSWLSQYASSPGGYLI